jgi:hypothetical protein
MSLPLTRKIEVAATEWLTSGVADADLNIYPGHGNAENVEFPALVVFGDACRPFEGMPPETGVKVVTLRLQFMADSTDESDATRERLDEWRDQIEAMMESGGLVDAINVPTSGADARPIRDVHCYDVEPAAQVEDRADDNWMEQLNYEVVCQSYDANSEPS